MYLFYIDESGNTGRDATPSLSEDALLRQLIRTRPVQRLRRIGFLGAIDRIKSRSWHSRYDHSLGVARLALLYAKSRNLSRHDTRVLAAAGLLHDVGHGPLSHTLEPIFQERFGISHHKAGVRIIRGESALGREIPEVLACHGLDPDEVNAMIGGTHNGRHAFVFSGPINLDTIEGVTRCFSFFERRTPKAMSATRIVREMAETDAPPIRTLDFFWWLKDQMYNSIIHDPARLVYDGLAQAAVTQDINDFEPSDFLKDERQLRRTNRKLFTLLDRARQSLGKLREVLPDSILSYEVVVPTRRFVRKASFKPKKLTDLRYRYRQGKTFRRVPVGSLLLSADSTKRRKAGAGLFYNGAHRTDVPSRTDLGRIVPYNAPASRKYLYGEQGGYCNGCAEHFQMRNLAVDHISNLQLLCTACNSRQGHQVPRRTAGAADGQGLDQTEEGGMMTESEAIFAQEAEKRDWDPEKIDEQSVPSGVKTPDFLICGGSVAVEVKQLDPRCDVERGDVAGVMGGVPGKRLRGLIKKANPQLRTLSVPGMLVVQNRTACSLHLDPFAVYSAMSGIETWEMPAVGDIHIIDPERDRFAGHTGATTTRTCNRAISCIAVLCEMYDGRPSVFGGGGPDPEYSLTVYHNPNAANPLQPDQLVGEHVTHYRMGRYDGWEKA